MRGEPRCCSHSSPPGVCAFYMCVCVTVRCARVGMPNAFFQWSNRKWRILRAAKFCLSC